MALFSLNIPAILLLGAGPQAPVLGDGETNAKMSYSDDLRTLFDALG